jgi:hypothetical protein
VRLRFGRRKGSEQAPAGEPAASATVPPLAQGALAAPQAAPAGSPSGSGDPAIESFEAASEAVKAQEAAQAQSRTR